MPSAPHAPRAKARPAAPSRGSLSPASKAFRVADYPFHRVMRVATLYSECLTRELKPRGMDQPRWRVLMVLDENSPAALGKLAELTVMKLPTLLKVVQRMTEEGWVRSGPRLSDQRVTDVSITPKGRKAVTLIRRVAADVYATATSHLSPRDMEILNVVLDGLEQNLRTHGRARRRAPSQGM